MRNLTRYLVAAAATAGLAVPAAAQYGYPQPGYPSAGQPYGYGQPSGYGQGGYGQNPVEQIIGQLLGNRYNVTDRQAVSRCASAAMVQAQAQYRGAYGQQGYGYPQGYQQGYGYNQGVAVPAMRVTAITDVQRRSNGLRVTGLMSSAHAGQYGAPYGNAYGYQQNRAYGDVSFRCNVDYRGAVTNIRIGRNNSAYRRY